MQLSKDANKSRIGEFAGNCDRDTSQTFITETEGIPQFALLQRLSERDLLSQSLPKSRNALLWRLAILQAWKPWTVEFCSKFNFLLRFTLKEYSNKYHRIRSYRVVELMQCAARAGISKKLSCNPEFRYDFSTQNWFLTIMSLKNSIKVESQK